MSDSFFQEGKTPHASIAALINTDINKNGKSSVFVKFGIGKFSIRPNFVAHITQNVVSQGDQALGMTLLSGSALPYIPFEYEAKWLEVKPSRK